jgi:hypothetical protein
VQLLKNFPAFYGSRRFITMFTRALSSEEEIPNVVLISCCSTVVVVVVVAAAAQTLSFCSVSLCCLLVGKNLDLFEERKTASLNKRE